MELDRNETDRSYLYGRLLAVYEKVEKWALGSNEDRLPNAIRLQAAYSQHPATTRKVIENALVPYYQKLGAKKSEYYKREIEEISLKLELDTTNRALSEMYLPGYWAERAELNKKKDKEDRNNSEEA